MMEQTGQVEEQSSSIATQCVKSSSNFWNRSSLDFATFRKRGDELCPKRITEIGIDRQTEASAPWHGEIAIREYA
jgi:hypothetical protein